MLINKPAGLLSLSAKIRATLTPCITGWFSAFGCTRCTARLRYLRSDGGGPQQRR